MTNIFWLLLIIVTVCISGCSAPKPAKISFTGKMEPVNFNARNIYDSNIVIRSEQQTHGDWNKQFTYSIDEDCEHSPEFYYYALHADKIIARIKPPFVEFVFAKVQSQLKSYGVTAIIELITEQDNDQNSQVVLECIKYNIKSCNR